MVRAETAVADAILNLTVARNNASVAQVNLALFLGIDPRTPIQTSAAGEPAISTNDVDALVRTALTRRPDIREFQENLRATEHAVSAAKDRAGGATVLGISSTGSFRWELALQPRRRRTGFMFVGFESACGGPSSVRRRLCWRYAR